MRIEQLISGLGMYLGQIHLLICNLVKINRSTCPHSDQRGNALVYAWPVRAEWMEETER